MADRYQGTILKLYSMIKEDFNTLHEILAPSSTVKFIKETYLDTVTEEMAIGREGEPAWLSIKLCQTETSIAISLAGEETLDKPEFGKFGFFKKKEKQRVKHFYLGERISDSSND